MKAGAWTYAGIVRAFWGACCIANWAITHGQCHFIAQRDIMRVLDLPSWNKPFILKHFCSQAQSYVGNRAQHMGLLSVWFHFLCPFQSAPKGYPQNTCDKPMCSSGLAADSHIKLCMRMLGYGAQSQRCAGASQRHATEKPSFASQCMNIFGCGSKPRGSHFGLGATHFRTESSTSIGFPQHTGLRNDLR